MIVTHTYTAENAGKKLLIIGNIHGDETCGRKAIERVRAEIESGKIKIAKGSVTFLPCANPAAAEKGVRYIDRNLNRHLTPKKDPKNYEEHLGNIICPLIENADVLLDLHSYVADVGSPPFVFAGTEDRKYERAFAASLGAQTMLHGWKEAYAASGRAQAPADPEESIGTVEYARIKGADAAVTLECGGHFDPETIDIAYRAIHNALRFTEIVADGQAQQASPRIVRVTAVIYRDDDGGAFVKPWKHLDQISKGEHIATRGSGEKLLAPYDGFVVLPHFDCQLGQEWFYYGKLD